MNGILDAQWNGFHCAQCSRFVKMVPVRSNDAGPYFDTFYCAFQYRAAQGDARAIEIVRQMGAMRNPIAVSANDGPPDNIESLREDILYESVEEG